jgi:hypothetical protein
VLAAHVSKTSASDAVVSCSQAFSPTRSAIERNQVRGVAAQDSWHARTIRCSRSAAAFSIFPFEHPGPVIRVESAYLSVKVAPESPPVANPLRLRVKQFMRPNFRLNGAYFPVRFVQIFLGGMGAYNSEWAKNAPVNHVKISTLVLMHSDSEYPASPHVFDGVHNAPMCCNRLSWPVSSRRWNDARRLAILSSMRSAICSRFQFVVTMVGLQKSSLRSSNSSADLRS